MDLGLHTTLADANSKLDPEVVALLGQINPTMSAEFGAVWDLFGRRAEPLMTDEFEVLSRDYTAPQVTVQASGGSADWDTNSDTTALPVSSGTIDRITVGDILLVDSEIVVVSAVDRSGNTIDVYERGAGESSAAAHGTSAVTALIVGNAHVEGTVNGEAMAERTDTFTNYAQLVEETVNLSHADSSQMRKTGRTTDTLKSEAMMRVMRDLARTAIYGVAVAPTTSKPGMTRGLLQWLQLSGGLTTNVSGAFTETVLANMCDDVRNQGGRVNAIIMSVAKKRQFNAFSSADQVQQNVADRTLGRVLDAYLADGFGAVPVIVDTDMADDAVCVVNTAMMSKAWKVDDQLRFEVEPTNSREKKETLQGKFGLWVEGVGTSHAIATNLS